MNQVISKDKDLIVRRGNVFEDILLFNWLTTSYCLISLIIYMNCLLLQLITFISVSKRQTQSGVDVGTVGCIGDGFVVTFPFRQFEEWYSIYLQ